MRNTGIPSTISLTNISPSSPFSILSPPSIYTIGQTGVDDLIAVTYISTAPTFGNEIADLVVEQVRNVQFEGKEEGEGEPGYAVMSIHRPFGLGIDAEAVEKGFYRDLYSLQEKKRTWWTGAA
jgi:hypothetical protein